MEPRIYEDGYKRAAQWSEWPIGVYQFASFDRASVWESAYINFGGSPARTSPDEAERFAQAILAAVALARQWNEERAGKWVGEG